MNGLDEHHVLLGLYQVHETVVVLLLEVLHAVGSGAYVVGCGLLDHVLLESCPRCVDQNCSRWCCFLFWPKVIDIQVL